LTNVNGTLFFNAGHTEYGGGGLMEELWKSDGTEAGTVMVKDLGGGNTPGYPAWLTNVNGTLFFTSEDGGLLLGIELFKSDGTEAGTVMVKDIYEGTTGVGSHAEPNSSNPMHFTNVLGMLFFTADDGDHGRELWRSDGTEAGTVMVYDIWAFALGSDPAWMTRHGYILALSAYDGLHGRELWGVDSFHHAYLIKDINTVFGYPELSRNPESLTFIGGTLFFAATGADGTARELWKSNGTEAGTFMVKDINPIGDSSLEGLTDINGKLLFFPPITEYMAVNYGQVTARHRVPRWWRISRPYLGLAVIQNG
jgi:ELWxxDGT repeat protein